MINAEIINKALLLMQEECGKHTTYSACYICPFGELCRKRIDKLTPMDINRIVGRYVESNMI